eukprot:sb/3467433/
MEIETTPLPSSPAENSTSPNLATATVSSTPHPDPPPTLHLMPRSSQFDGFYSEDEVDSYKPISDEDLLKTPRNGLKTPLPENTGDEFDINPTQDELIFDSEPEKSEPETEKDSSGSGEDKDSSKVVIFGKGWDKKGAQSNTAVKTVAVTTSIPTLSEEDRGVISPPKPDSQLQFVLAMILCYAVASGYFLTSTILYFYPQILHRTKQIPFPYRTMAHRGGGGERTENTMVAFKHAQTLGVDLFELDVQMGEKGNHEDDSLYYPYGLTITRDDQLLVSDQVHSRNRPKQVNSQSELVN